MTENEAIGILENVYEKYVRDCDNEDEYMKQNFAITEAIKSLSEIQQYRAIGTVEECREARERQRAKKPIDEYIHCISKVYQGNCPVCGNHVYADLCNITPMKYCQYCGQAIDWSDTP